ncbi:MAG TPA: iron-containing alcohol dehydrogenase [Candidatus Agathobaculum intestinipullorum]|nr:iron-containing alcohol dehydrogenase [Candidatus Agathobaculum intestinipullorum]
MDNFGFYLPTRIFFGPGAVQKLARARLPEGRGLIVTGGTSTTRLGYVAKVQDALAEAGHETIVFNKVQPNPTIEGVRECAALCRAEGIAFVVGLGGGSSIDTAKAVAIMATNDGDWWDYVHGGTGGGKRIVNDGLPIVAIPTTAGTGTEADPFTVITNGEEKIGGGGEKCFPTISVVDPDFMMTVPPHLTAYQGFDAFFHAAEGYLATCATPISEIFSLKAIELIGRSLATAVHDGGNRQARADVALANTLAGFVETLSSCTGEHAIEHALSAFHPALPHGAGLIMISKAYWSRFFESAGDRLVAIARALGKQDAAKPEDFIAALTSLQKRCNVHDLRLSGYGVQQGDFGKYADNAMGTMGALFRVDPRPLSREDIVGILAESYK